MLKPILFGLTLAVVAVTSGDGVATPQDDRPDCPGRIVCPVTGQEICADRCPADAALRPDCPVTAAQTDQPTQPRACCVVTP